MTTDRDLTLAASLAAVAGFVDAVGFTSLFGVFPANQSGNAVLLGIGIGDVDGSEIWRPLLAVVAFAVGVAVGIVLRRRVPDARAIPTLLGLEAGLLIVLAAVAGEISGSAPAGGSTEVVMLAVAAGAMGLQTDVIRRASGVTLATTYQTGAIDRIAESATDAVLGKSREPNDTRGPLSILVVVLGCYVGGAAIGAAISDAWGRAMWVPAAVVVVLFVLTGVSRRQVG